MKRLYPAPAYLSTLLKAILQGSQHKAGRIPILLDSLDSVQRQKLVRDLPLYCDSATLKPVPIAPEARQTIALFRLGKEEKDLKAMETVIGILLDRAKYEKAPFTWKKLANTLSEFLWHFKGSLDAGMWQLLESVFDLQFVFLKDDLTFLQDSMKRYIEQLRKLEGRVPFFPLEKTQRFLREQLRTASGTQQGIVELKRAILEQKARQEKGLAHDEYIPFDESLFLLWEKNALRLLDTDAESFRFAAMNVPEQHEISYDKKSKVLRIREKLVHLARAAEQKKLAAVLADFETLGKEWFYTEILSGVDNVAVTEKRCAAYDNAAYQLNRNIQRQAGFENFLIKTGISVKINPQYLS